LTPTIISAGKFKGEGNEFAPLSDEARAAIQADVDTFYSMFVDAVAKGRGVSTKEVRAGFGEGRMATARAAVSLGMADKIATLDETLASMMRVRGRSGSRARAEIGLLELEGLALR
jgi:ClpP class serine protease